MRRIQPNFLWVILSLGWLCITPSLLACSSDPPPERYYITYFDAELAGDTSYRPCYLDAEMYHNEWDYYSLPLADKYRANLLEWQKYADNKPALADIADIIYELDPFLLTDVMLPAMIGGKPIPPPLGNNLFIRQLAQKKDIAAIKYLIFSRECEPHIQGQDMWEPKPINKDTMKILIDKGKSLYEEAPSEFLRLRFGFQTVRLAHYMGDYQQAVALYDRLIAPLAAKFQTSLAKESQVTHWATALKAGALKQLGQYGESLYYFSKAFANNPDKRGMILQNCTANEEAWQKAVSLAKTEQERAVLWTMKAANSEVLGFDELKKVYENSPKSVEVDVILLREVNKIERQLLSPYLMQSLTNANADEEEEEMEGSFIPSHQSSASFFEGVGRFFSSIWEWLKGFFGGGKHALSVSTKYPKELQNKQYIEQLRDFVAQTADQGQVRTPALWQTAAAYLSYLAEDYAAANQRLDQVKTTDKAIVQQADLVRGLARIATEPVNEAAENDFYRALSGRKHPEDVYANYGVVARSLAALAQQYLRQGNVPKAALCLYKAQETGAANILLDCYASEAQLEELLALAQNGSKTPFENYLFKNNRLDRDVILDVQGTCLMRKGNYTQALAKFEQITPKYWATRTQDETMFGQSYSTFETGFEENSLLNINLQTSFNKLTFARKVVELEQKANSDTKKAATYYLQLANGFYGTPFWGYNGKLWDGTLLYTLGYGDYTEYPLNIPGLLDSLVSSQQQLRNNYGKRDVAMRFYQKVIDISTDPELSAKAAYLAHTCPLMPFASFHEADTLQLTYAKLIRNKYSQTAFISELIKECATAADVLGK